MVRYVLENTRLSVFRGMRQILRSGQQLEIILYLIAEGGEVHMTGWNSETQPPDAVDIIAEMCRETDAVAALFVAEFNEIADNTGYRVAAVHWCYPADHVSDSSFFILDPDNLDINEDHEESCLDVPDDLIDWLDEALESAQAR